MTKQGMGLWIVVCALLVLDIAVHCVRAQDNTHEVLKAQEIEIVDASGNQKMDFRVSKEGSPVIALFDSKGNPRAGMVADDTGGSIDMLDTSGKAVTFISGDSKTPSFAFMKAGTQEGYFGLREDGWPTMTLDDSAGTDRVFLGYDPDKDRSLFQLTDKDDKQIAEMAVVPDYSIVDATDKAGTRRAAIRCTSDGAPSVYVADKDGNPVWQQTDSGQSQ